MNFDNKIYRGKCIKYEISATTDLLILKDTRLN